MRKLTKLFSALIVLVLATAFIGCGNPSSSSDGTGGGNNTVTVIWNADVFDGGRYDTTVITKDGITLTTNEYIDCSSRMIQNGGTFTTSLGKFTKIEVKVNAGNISGTGWSDRTWTGDASDSVSFSGNIYGTDYFQITFTIEQ